MSNRAPLSCLIALAALALAGCSGSQSDEDFGAVCAEIACSGHGTCAVKSDQQPICICNAGYHLDAGNLLECIADEADTNACSGVTCDHGTCAVNVNHTAMCICDAGYHLDAANLTSCTKDEEGANPCEGIDCSGNGVCTVKDGMTAVCLCNGGYHRDDDGTACVADAPAESPCKDITCSGHGTCGVNADGNAMCLCDDGYHMNAADLTSCEADEAKESACKDIDCDGNGSCAVKDDGSAICICSTGYHLNASNLKSCEEDTVEESACKDVDCSGNGVCAVKDDGSAICICNAGYHLNASNLKSCEQDMVEESACKDVDCDGNGVCAVKDDGSAICICNERYHADNSGLKCVADEPAEDPCKDIDCGRKGGMGKCAVIGQMPICACYEGSHLDELDLTVCMPNGSGVTPCDGVDCSGFGQCAVKGNDTPICICQDGYHLDTSDLTACVKDDPVVDPCETVTCGGFGQCAVKNGDTPICICHEGYHTTMEDLTVCKANDPAVDPCAASTVDCGTGICTVKQSDNTAICICADGYHIEESAPAVCVADPDSPCKDQTCSGSGVCAVKEDGTAGCICPRGYYSAVSSGKPICALTVSSICHYYDCDGHGKCGVVNLTSPACVCDEGYHATAEDPKHCVENESTVNPCDGIDCGGHGICTIDASDNPVCLCTGGYENSDTTSCSICNGYEFQDQCVKEGSFVTFGNYYYSNATDLEPITWRILSIDADNMRMLLLTEHTIEVHDYYYYHPGPEQTYVWKESGLRRWMNETFYNLAFNTEEQNLILTTHLDPDPEDLAVVPGEATDDKIFALSQREAYGPLRSLGGKGFGTYIFSDSIRKTTPTPYAHQLSTETYNSFWWLRTSIVGGDLYKYGIYGGYGAFFIDHTGGLYGPMGYDGNMGVRPATWVSLHPCRGDQVWDKDTNACTTCSGNTVPNSYNSACSCTGKNALNSAQTSCVACTGDTVPNADHTACIKCDGNLIYNSDKTACIECSGNKVPNMEHTACVCNGAEFQRRCLTEGDLIWFGTYHNTPSDTDPIRWRVLKTGISGPEGDLYMLLLSEYIIDAYKYHNTNESLTWETSDMRTFLNGEFYTNAFYAEEKALMGQLNVLNNDSNYASNVISGSDTKDKVFLLSQREAYGSDGAGIYFLRDSDRKAIPTEYAISQGVTVNADGTAPWWLRTPYKNTNLGLTEYRAGTITEYGNFSSVTAVNTKVGIRPAIWVRYKKTF